MIYIGTCLPQHMGDFCVGTFSPPNHTGDLFLMHGTVFLNFVLCIRLMPNPKRQRRQALHISSVPPDLMQIVITFAAPTLADVAALAVLSRYFRDLILSPNMAGHVRANFTSVWDRLHELGPLVKGVRATHAQLVTNLHGLSCMPALRVLELPHGEFDSGMFNEAMRTVPYLHMLNVNSCAGLLSITTLPATLRLLNVSDCVHLRHLPASLLNVYDLNVNYCSNLLTLPRMPKLEVLKMEKCPATLAVNSTMRRLKKNLLRLDPSVIEHCTALEILDVTDCDVFDIDFTTPLCKLVTLFIQFAETGNDMDLSGLIGLKNLRVLRLENDITDEHLESVNKLPDLFSLTLMSHLLTDDGVRSIAQIKGLTYLVLDNYDCMGITADGFAACAEMRGLRMLSLKYCQGVEDLSTLANFSGLHELCFVGCSAISNLAALCALKSLTTLEFDSCDSITTLEGLKLVPKLTTLSVMCCRNLSRCGLWALMPCPSLTHLRMCEHTSELLVEGDLEPFHTHNVELSFV